jgi:TonB family protein
MRWRILVAPCFAFTLKRRLAAVPRGLTTLMVAVSSTAFGQGTPIVASRLSQSTDLVRYVKPRCPANIHAAQPTTVQLRVVINVDGNIKTVEFEKGDSRFRREALRAVKLWKYKPVTVQGTRVEIKTEIQLTFSCP